MAEGGVRLLTTTEVRNTYVNGRYGDDDYPGVEVSREEFDRWLADLVEKVEDRVWDDAADAYY